MTAGFFKVTDVTAKAPVSLLPACGACGLFKAGCRSPKMPVDGEGRRGILVIGEGPGKNEDDQGKPFVGASGQLMQETLAKFDVDFRRDCWIYNSIICRAMDKEGRNRPPSPKEVGYCRPNVVRTIKELKPKVIILLGGPAVRSVIGWLWKPDPGPPSTWDGWRIPSQEINAWICPTWHPAYILRTDYGDSERENPVRRLFFEKHLKAACELKGRPWKEVPRWSEQVRCLLDDALAKRELLPFIEGDRPVAFDFETTMLKPDHADARIWTCSVSDGRRTVAYPWSGDWIKWTRRLLRTNVPKIASNLQFEERWAIKEFGHGVNGWNADTMVDAHVLDNRRGITSIKFQGFVQCGQPLWDGKVRPYLRAKGNNEPNRIRECSLPDVLLYNGMDSLIEWQVARKQDRQINALGVREGSTLFRDGSVALARAAANGIKVDEDHVKRNIARADRRILKLSRLLAEDEVAVTWRKTYGPSTNFGSNAQLEHVLYDVMKFAAKGTTDKGRRSTSKSALEGIDLPFLKLRGKIESLKKARSTYLVGLLRETVDGRCHPNISLGGGSKESDEEKSGARTYRSGSSDPNIQNQERRDEMLAAMVRKSFIASRGCRLVEVDFCLVGDTLIQTLDGKQPIKQVVKRLDAGEDVWVYGYDFDKGRVGVSKVIRGALTRKRAEVWEVVLDNGESVRGTPDHKFIRRNGSEVMLKDLKPGDSLMPFYHKTKKSRGSTNYKKVYLNNGEHMLAHNLIALDVYGVQIAGSDKVVHHWDGNGCNNSLENLEVITRSRHMSIHSKQGWRSKNGRAKHLKWCHSKKNKELLSAMSRRLTKERTPEGWKEIGKRISESIKRRGGYHGKNNAMFGKQHSASTRAKMAELKNGYMPSVAGWNKGLTKETSESVRKISEAAKGRPAWNAGKKLPPLSSEHRRKLSEAGKGRIVNGTTREKLSVVRKRFWANKKREQCKICGQKFKSIHYMHTQHAHGMTVKEYRETYNHEVVSVRQLSKREDVYNIAVSGFHSYALGAGIIVKNCAVEFRIAACFWRDPAMIAYASDPAKDVHRDMAASLFKCKAGQVSKKPMRDISKNQFTFPVIYGSWYKKIAANIWGDLVRRKVVMEDGDALVLDWLRENGIAELGDCANDRDAVPGTFEHHVKEVEERFLAKFPVFAQRKVEWIAQYRERGWFPLLSGFRCEGIYTKNNCLNYPIQGPAFHVLLWSMIELQREIDRREMLAKLIAEIHDATLGDVPDEEVQTYLTLSERIMTKRVRKHWPWIVTPLEVEAKVSEVGGSWHEMEPWVEANGVWGPAGKAA